jgi:FMN-dependent NADH-azoreductase
MGFQQWVEASYTPRDKRTPAQNEILALSDTLIKEIMDADVIILSVSIYNFNIPGSLKAWIDQVIDHSALYFVNCTIPNVAVSCCAQVARSGVTFKYGQNGPEGLIKGKRVYVVSASGGIIISCFSAVHARRGADSWYLFTGTPRGSPNDYYSTYLQFMMKFIGLSDLTWVADAVTGSRKEDSVAAAIAAIDANDFSLPPPLRGEL